MIHPQQWVAFYRSHTDYEWALQVAADQVEPFGEERDDIRSAIHTANVMVSNCWGEGPNAIEFREMVRKLMSYLKSPEGDDEIPDQIHAEALEAIRNNGE